MGARANRAVEVMSVRAGALCWISAVQFFVTQIVVATAWQRPFSLRFDYISDLGNTACAANPSAATAICSPWHAAMNASFITIGCTMAFGAVWSRPAFAAGVARTLAVSLFVIAGLGVVLVGANPENENNALHVFGAAINFVPGNAALVLFGVAARRWHQSWFAVIGVALGIVGLTSTVLFVSGHYFGLGVGGMERLTAYPMPIWQIIAGTVLLTRRAG